MPPSSDSPLFIVGCDRSGTTLLRLILTNNPDIHILHETGFLRNLRNREEEYGDFTEPRQRWYFIRDLQYNKATTETYSFSAFNLADAKAEAVLSEAAPTDFAGAARALFEATARKEDASRWGDKTPRHVLALPWLADAFPNAQFLHIIRDGRDVAASFQRVGWKGGNLRKAARAWRTRTGAGLEAGAKLPPERYHEVRYESLVRNPEDTTQSLCNWLGLSFTHSMLTFHKNSGSFLPEYAHKDLYKKTYQPIDPSRAQAWKEDLTPREIADIEDVASDLLSDLGYELNGARVPLWLRGLRSVHQNTIPLTRSLVKKLKRLGLGKS